MDTLDVTKKYVTTTITTNARSNKTTQVTLGDRIVEQVEILFAPGHVALTGVSISYGGLQFVPYGQPGVFIFGDNERLTFELGLYAPGPWTVNTHNNDGVAHLHQLTWRLSEVPRTGPLPGLAPIPVIVG